MAFNRGHAPWRFCLASPVRLFKDKRKNLQYKVNEPRTNADRHRSLRVVVSISCIFDSNPSKIGSPKT